MSTPPPASGVRVPWSALPEHLLSEIEAQLGDSVVEAVSQPGGFSPAVAARVTSRNGSRAFVKATAPDTNPDAPGIYRQEARIAAALPPWVPAPRLLWTMDEGEHGWVVLMFEDIDGQNPPTPWHTDDLTRVLEILRELHAGTLPADMPVPSAAASLDRFGGWRSLAEHPLPGLDPWSSRYLDRLAQLERRALTAGQGDRLIHFDVRADNVVLARDRAYLVDWPHAGIGDPAIDLAGFAPSVAMQEGPEPEELFRLSGIDTDPDAVNAIVAAVAGLFTHRALLPPPPGLPTLRAFQAAQGVVARRWLAQRTGWK
jgi:aminoglycoside phosphotransferase (APT) family kinase protein